MAMPNRIDDPCWPYMLRLQSIFKQQLKKNNYDAQI